MQGLSGPHSQLLGAVEAVREVYFRNDAWSQAQKAAVEEDSVSAAGLQEAALLLTTTTQKETKEGEAEQQQVDHLQHLPARFDLLLSSLQSARDALAFCSSAAQSAVAAGDERAAAQKHKLQCLQQEHELLLAERRRVMDEQLKQRILGHEEKLWQEFRGKQ
jgi:hypothetical protein